VRPAEEVEQTIRVSRDRIEQDIARYRLWYFALAAAANSAVNLVRQSLGSEVEWHSPAWFAFGLGYALLARTAVLRWGAAPWLSRTLMAVDMFAAVANFLVAPVGRHPELLMWPVHVAPAALMLILLINLLRNDPLGAILSGAAGFVTCAGVLVVYEGLVPQLAPLACLFLLASLVGVRSARQARANLDLHGRLQLLRRYLSPAAVSRVMQDRPESALALGGKLVTLTVLTSDLRGFTAMSERLAPEELVRQLNEFHGLMLAQIDRHGGVLDKFIGDGMLAMFGLDVATLSTSEDAGAAAAVACARDMLEALEHHNQQRTAQGLDALKIGVGIHTGPVVAGNVGAPERRLEFTIIGDAVNTAARLEGLTKETGTPVLISAATATRAGDPQLSELPSMVVRGKEERVRVFALGPARAA